MQKLQGTQRFALYMLSVKYQPLDSDLGYINHVRVDLSALARQFATNPVVNTRLIASRNNTILSDRSSRTEKKEEHVIVWSWLYALCSDRNSFLLSKKCYCLGEEN